MDLESPPQLNFLNTKWSGNPLNDSDIGYDYEWDHVVITQTDTKSIQ